MNQSQAILWASLFALAQVAFIDTSYGQWIATEGHVASAGRIESRVVDPYMSNIEERSIIARLAKPYRIGPEIDSLDELAVAFEGYLPVVIDRISLEEIGLSSDAPLEPCPQEAQHSAGANLLWFLEQHDLTFLIRHARLEITTHEAAEASPCIRIYDVTQLLTVVRDNGRASVDFESLEQCILTSVRRDTWERLGGPSTLHPMIVDNRCLLIVTAPTIVQLEVDQLLHQLSRNRPAVLNRRPQSRQVGVHKRTAVPIFAAASRPVGLPFFSGPVKPGPR